MAMRDENINITYSRIFQKFNAERAQSRSSIENEHVIAATDFDARSVAAITNCRWTRTRDASSDAPEPNPHRGFQHSACPKNYQISFIWNKRQCRACRSMREKAPPNALALVQISYRAGRSVELLLNLRMSRRMGGMKRQAGFRQRQSLIPAGEACSSRTHPA